MINWVYYISTNLDKKLLCKGQKMNTPIVSE